VNRVSKSIDQRPWVERDLIDFAALVAVMMRTQKFPKAHEARQRAEADVKRKIAIILRRREPRGERVREGGAL
jgi:hypothetical protein